MYDTWRNLKQISFRVFPFGNSKYKTGGKCHLMQKLFFCQTTEGSNEYKLKLSDKVGGVSAILGCMTLTTKASHSILLCG